MTDQLPKTLIDAVRYFSDRDVCHAYMRRIKWPGGVVTCPKCGGESVKELATRPGLLKCNRKDCQKQFSLRAGTYMEGSHAPLSAWLLVNWCEANHAHISAKQLAGALGVTVKTAWEMRSIVRAMVARLPIDGEDWRPIVGYEGLYEVSNQGRVRSLARTRRSRTGRTAKVGMRLIVTHKLPSPHNHWIVTLSKDGNRSSYPLHCVVLTAFAGPAPDGLQCRHLDGDPDNNRRDNLSWGTPLENAADRDAHGRTARGDRNAAAQLTEAQAREIKSRPMGYGTGKRIAKEYGVSESIISDIRKGRTWSHL